MGMTEIKITDDVIWFGDVRIKIWMSFAEVYKRLEPLVYVKGEPGENGAGYIVIKELSFCGLKGKATLVFVADRLKKITMEPEWQLYDLTDEQQQRLPIYKAVEKIAQGSRQQLEETYGAPVRQTMYGEIVYTTGEMTVHTAISPAEDMYTLRIC